MCAAIQIAIKKILTSPFVSEQLFFSNYEVMIFIKFPELAVYDIKMFVGKKVCFIVNVIVVMKM